MLRRNEPIPAHNRTCADSEAGGACGDAAWYEALAARLRSAASGCPVKTVADRTGTHPETVRRYLQNGRVCARFLAEFGEAFGVSLDWLLTGRVEPSHRHGAKQGTQPMLVTAVLELTGKRVIVREAQCSAVERNGRGHRNGVPDAAH